MAERASHHDGRLCKDTLVIAVDVGALEVEVSFHRVVHARTVFVPRALHRHRNRKRRIGHPHQVGGILRDVPVGRGREGHRLTGEAHPVHRKRLPSHAMIPIAVECGLDRADIEGRKI
jgi:hypothetical protein